MGGQPGAEGGRGGGATVYAFGRGDANVCRAGIGTPLAGEKIRHPSRQPGRPSPERAGLSRKLLPQRPRQQQRRRAARGPLTPGPSPARCAERGEHQGCRDPFGAANESAAGTAEDAPARTARHGSAGGAASRTAGRIPHRRHRIARGQSRAGRLLRNDTDFRTSVCIKGEGRIHAEDAEERESRGGKAIFLRGSSVSPRPPRESLFLTCTSKREKRYDSRRCHPEVIGSRMRSRRASIRIRPPAPLCRKVAGWLDLRAL